jgi:hypothetical protein
MVQVSFFIDGKVHLQIGFERYYDDVSLTYASENFRSGTLRSGINGNCTI